MEFWNTVREWLEALPSWVVNGAALLALVLAVLK